MAVRTKAQWMANRVLIVGFCVAIALPLAVQVFGLESAVTSTEKRTPSPLPGIPIKKRDIKAYPARFEAYYSDHFGLRGRLIRWYNLVKLRWLGSSSSPKVVIGQDGWLFYSWKPVGIDYPETRPLTTEQLKQWQHLLEARRAWLADRGIPFLFVIAPEKQSIYPEYLPAHLRNRGPKPSRSEQIVEHLRTHSDLKVVDLRQSLLEAKERERVFHRTDSHWNYPGSFVAYQQVTSAIGMEPLPHSEFVASIETTPGGDLAAMLGISDQVNEEVFNLEHRKPRARLTGERVAMREKSRLGHLKPLAVERPDGELPRVVVFHDSFGQALTPFLSEHFQRAVWIPSYVFDPEIVDREQPNLVIQLVVERHFLADPPTDPMQVNAPARASGR